MFRCNNDSLFPEKYTVKDLISDTKLGKGNHYYIQTRHKDLFSHYNLILRKLYKKSARKYKRNVVMPPGHPIILFKSNQFNMAAISVKRPIAKERKKRVLHKLMFTNIVWEI